MFVNAAASAERGLILCEIAEGQLGVLSVCQRGKPTPTAASANSARSWKDERPNNNVESLLTPPCHKLAKILTLIYLGQDDNVALKMFAARGNIVHHVTIIVSEQIFSEGAA